MSENSRDMKVVVRDFPKIFEFIGLFAVCSGLLIAIPASDLTSGRINDAVGPVLFLLVVAAVFLNALRLCLGGIKIRDDKVSYYVSITGVPIFRRDVDAQSIVDLSSEIQHTEVPSGRKFKTYLTNISGIDFQSVISWKSRVSRDRFLSVMKHTHPHITVHRIY